MVGGMVASAGNEGGFLHLTTLHQCIFYILEQGGSFYQLFEVGVWFMNLEVHEYYGLNLGLLCLYYRIQGPQLVD